MKVCVCGERRNGEYVEDRGIEQQRDIRDRLERTGKECLGAAIN